MGSTLNTIIEYNHLPDEIEDTGRVPWWEGKREEEVEERMRKT